MTDEIAAVRKRLATGLNRTCVWLFAAVRALVHDQRARVTKRFTALVALMGPMSGVSTRMHLQTVLAPECLWALIARKWPVSAMDNHVIFEIIPSLERQATFLTRIY